VFDSRTPPKRCATKRGLLLRDAGSSRRLACKINELRSSPDIIKEVMCGYFPAWLIPRRFLDAIDDEDFNGAFRRFEFQPELIL
jgi:hypothetical protein